MFWGTGIEIATYESEGTHLSVIPHKGEGLADSSYGLGLKSPIYAAEPLGSGTP